MKRELIIKRVSLLLFITMISWILIFQVVYADDPDYGYIEDFENPDYMIICTGETGTATYASDNARTFTNSSSPKSFGNSTWWMNLPYSNSPARLGHVQYPEAIINNTSFTITSNNNATGSNIYYARRAFPRFINRSDWYSVSLKVKSGLYDKVTDPYDVATPISMNGGTNGGNFYISLKSATGSSAFTLFQITNDTMKVFSSAGITVTNTVNPAAWYNVKLSLRQRSSTTGNYDFRYEISGDGNYWCGVINDVAYTTVGQYVDYYNASNTGEIRLYQNGNSSISERAISIIDDIKFCNEGTRYDTMPNIKTKTYSITDSVAHNAPTSLTPGRILNISSTVTNSIIEGTTGRLVAALYNADGVLEKISMGDEVLIKNDAVTNDMSFSDVSMQLPQGTTNNSKIKLFIWDNLNSIHPLANATDVTDSLKNVLQ